MVYGWWSTGLAPFSAVAYVAVAVPVVALAAAVAVTRWSEGTPRTTARHGALPWLVLLVAAGGLEWLAMALGGRSTTVPTISTLVDHLLRWHGSRLVLFLFWLGLGWWPVARARGLVRTGASR